MLSQMKVNTEEGVTFDQFLELMRKIEVKIEKKEEDKISEMAKSDNSKVEPRTTYIQTDQKVLDFLKLLEEYRIKCENEGQYAEARKSRLKYEELLRKESIRQKNNIRTAQELELQSIENAQKSQFLEFSQAWDNYMSEYEATAYLSLEKLKEKHLLEFQQFQEKV